MVRARSLAVGLVVSVIALATAPLALAATSAPTPSKGSPAAQKSASTPQKTTTPSKGSSAPQKSGATSTKSAASTQDKGSQKSTASHKASAEKSTGKSAAAPKTAKKEQTPAQKSLGTFGSWWAYSEGAGDGRVCYAGTRPGKKEGKVAGRRDAYLLVTNRPGQKATGEISLSSGYPFKEGSDAVATIGDKKFKMFTRGDNAWTYDAQADKAMVGALKAGKQIVVTGTVKTGQVTTDTYSLAGFPKALAAIDKACGG